jgi:DNA-binding NarL/FixJ family response regulator
VNRSNPIRLLLVDSHALTRSALGCLLGSQHGITLVGEATTLAEGVAHCGASAPEIILLHLRHEGGLGVEAISPLLLSAPADSRLLLVTEIVDADVHRRAVRLGASGIVGTDRPAETLFKAIEKVLEGEVWMERRLVADLIGPAHPRPDGDQTRIGSLTPREREVVRLLCQGLRNKQIAGHLAVTDVTVRHHLTSVFSKLGVSDRLGLLLYASKHGMTPANALVPSHSAHPADAVAHDEQ